MAEICRNHIQSRLDNLLYFLVGGNYMNCLVEIFRSHRCFATDCKHKCSYFEEVFRWRNPAVVGASQIHPVLLFLYPAVVGVVLILSISEEDWIGSRDNLQETIDFPMKYGSFRLRFSQEIPKKTNPSPRKSILRSTSPFPTALPSSPLNAAACCAAFGSGKSDGIETSRAVA